MSPKPPKPDTQSVTVLTPDDLVPLQAQLDAQAAQLAAHETMLADQAERIAVLETGDLGPPEPPDATAPDKAIWEAHMVEWGVIHGDWLDTQPEPSNDAKLDHVYYDQGYAMYQIGEYVGEAEPWNTYAKKALAWFYDYAITRNGGSVPGYYNFTHGLRLDYEKTGDARSKQGVITLSEKAMYALTTYDETVGADFRTSREVAYAILSYINAEALGEPPREQRPRRVQNAYNHCEQFLDPGQWGTLEITPFMFAITCQALIADWETTADARCLPTVKEMLDFVWPLGWHEPSSALYYQINPAYASGISTTGAVDLNMIIAPWCSWLYVQTGDVQYRDKFDAMLFGSKDSYLQRAKQFNQNYWWSFEGMRWREEGPA